MKLSILCRFTSIFLVYALDVGARDLMKNEGLAPASLFIYSPKYHPEKPSRQSELGRHGFQTTTAPPPVVRGSMSTFVPGRETLHKNLINYNPPKEFKKMKKSIIRQTDDGQIEKKELEGVVLLTEEGRNEVFVPEDLIHTTNQVLTKIPYKLRHLRPFFASNKERNLSERVDGRQPIRRHVRGRMMRGMPFSFQYIVDDEGTQNYQTRQEEGDSQGVVRGCYQVLEPTGLVRTVSYKADSNGFRVLSITNGPDKIPCTAPERRGKLSPFQRAFNANLQGPPLIFNYDGNRYSSKYLSSGQFRGDEKASHQWSNSFDRNKGTRSQKTFRDSSQHNTFDTSEKDFNSNNFYGDNYETNFDKQITNHQSNSGFKSARNFHHIESLSNVQQGLKSKELSAKDFAHSQTLLNKESFEREENKTTDKWLADYVNNLSKTLFNTFKNITTLTSSESDYSNFLNFPFVLIPITSFVKLRQKGLIEEEVQGFGAIINPMQRHKNASTFASHPPKSVQKVVTNVYNTQIKETKQIKTEAKSAQTRHSFKTEQKNDVRNSRTGRFPRDFRHSAITSNHIHEKNGGSKRLRSVHDTPPLLGNGGSVSRKFLQSSRINPSQEVNGDNFQSFQPSRSSFENKQSINPTSNDDSIVKDHPIRDVNIPQRSRENLASFYRKNNNRSSVRRRPNINVQLSSSLNKFKNRRKPVSSTLSQGTKKVSNTFSNEDRVTIYTGTNPDDTDHSKPQMVLGNISKRHQKDSFLPIFSSGVPKYGERLIPKVKWTKLTSTSLPRELLI